VRVEPFAVDVPDGVLQDLFDRVRRTRWPDPAPGEPWAQGVDLRYLRGLLDHVDGVRIHFVHHRAGPGRTPLVLTHGWPSTFVEMLSLVDRLGDRFDLVVPSLPGYGFSERPHAPVDRTVVAGLWHRLMQGLGYERYGAHGGDFGAGVATAMALTQPERVIGIHLSTAEMAPYVGPGSPPLTAEEQAYVDHVARWEETERGYSSVQSTRPQTLAYGLNDSPAGLAAWVLDKWRSWSDSGGDLDATFGRDALLTMLTIWWATGTIASSMRDYYDNRWHASPIGPGDVVGVPTAMALFTNEFVPEGEPPRSWYERLYAVRRWTVFPRGGHFAAAEEPDLLAADIAEFFTGPHVRA
jgi:pimeloyl-ACP methyl ester carboxylesterase